MLFFSQKIPHSIYFRGDTKKILLNVAWKYLKVQHLSTKNVTFTFHAMAGSRVTFL